MNHAMVICGMQEIFIFIPSPPQIFINNNHIATRLRERNSTLNLKNLNPKFLNPKPIVVVGALLGFPCSLGGGHIG